MTLYRKHRPATFGEVIGHEHEVQLLKSKIESHTLPNTCLFSGPTGVGKTTLARIVAKELGCTESNLIQVNCADFRSIDDVRGIRESMNLHPMGGTSRIWILDECVQLPKTTQQAFLAILEDTPKHVYFLLCTSDLSGLLPTFVGRCFHIQLPGLKKSHLQTIVEEVAKKENRDLDSDVVEAIATTAQGSARMALQLLEAALVWDESDNQLEAIGAAKLVQEESELFLGKALFQRTSWGVLAKILNGLEDKDIEGTRRAVLVYASKVLLGGDSRGLVVIEQFREPFLSSGKAGLVGACWRCLQKG